MPIMILLWWTVLLVRWPVGTTAVLVALAITGLAIAWDKERQGPRREVADGHPSEERSGHARARP